MQFIVALILMAVICGFIGRILGFRKLPELVEEELEIDKETIQFLLKHKLSYLNTVATVCMSWWVSSIVFCGTILAAVWLKRGDLVKSDIILPLGGVVAFFFLTFICFGICALIHLGKFRDDISTLSGKLKPEGLKPFFSNIFKREINSIWWGILIGITTFILILGVWFYLFIGLYKGCWKVPEETNKPSNTKLQTSGN